MRLPLHSKPQILWIIGLSGALLALVLLFWLLRGEVWTRFDWYILDRLYRYAAQTGHTPQASPQIVYLTVDDGTYQTLGKNTLDRGMLAQVNTILAGLGPQAVGYDIIFAYPSDPVADQQFAASITSLGSVYLPYGGDPTPQRRGFIWDSGIAYQRLQTEFLKRPAEIGWARPYATARVLPQYAPFAAAAFNAGHIAALPDADGVFRHQLLLLKIEDCYLPALSLAMFLDYLGVPFEQVIIEWGHAIRIPAGRSRYLDAEFVIPIDAQGRAVIPFPQVWGKDFKNMPVQDLLQHAADATLAGNLESFFSGKFVFIGDIAHGADVGQTPLETNVPLISTHAAMLNGLLTQTLYRQWSLAQTLSLLCGAAILLTAASLLKSAWPLYAVGGGLLASIGLFTYVQFCRLVMIPVVASEGSLLVLLTGLGLGLSIRKRAFILGAFARYVPETVVRELLKHPEKLTLGGEKRTISVLFSDLQGFTSISEKLSPEALVALLNEYLTEMTTIILNAGGIIDKYQGDAIMAEFGAPLPLPDHADRAVSAALQMQQRLRALRQQWAAKGLPELQCRIGINTGEVILGNMGSHQVFDYTVIGDDVNLASRLESANKQYHTFLMISEATYKQLTPGRFRTRVLDVIKVKGKSQAVKVYEVYGAATDTCDERDVTYYETYQAGFEAYLTRDFTQASERCAVALQLRPNDPAAKGLISRIVALNPAELPDDWDGSVALTSK